MVDYTENKNIIEDSDIDTIEELRIDTTKKLDIDAICKVFGVDDGVSSFLVRYSSNEVKGPISEGESSKHIHLYNIRGLPEYSSKWDLESRFGHCLDDFEYIIEIYIPDLIIGGKENFIQILTFIEKPQTYSDVSGNRPFNTEEVSCIETIFKEFDSMFYRGFFLNGEDLVDIDGMYKGKLFFTNCSPIESTEDLERSLNNLISAYRIADDHLKKVEN